MGKGKRLKRERAEAKERRATLPAEVPDSASSQLSPGQLAVDEEELTRQLSEMPPDSLLTFGMASMYLASSPVRDANQCLLASLVLRDAIRHYGVDAELVALSLEIPWARPQQVVRYGRPDPHLSNGQVRGHVGLIADGWLLDPTASQFPEIRDNGGVRVVGNDLGSSASRIATEGGGVQVNLSTGKSVLYYVHPVGSADAVEAEFLSSQRDPEAVRGTISNHLVIFRAMLAATRPDVQTSNAQLNAEIRSAIGKEVVNDGNWLSLADPSQSQVARGL